jgi:hypothetical protein
MTQNYTPEQIAVYNAVKTLQDACYGAANASGWWTTKDGTSVKDNPLKFSNSIALIHSEVSESLEADRKDLNDDHLTHRKGREVELGDALIRICDTAGGFDMDLAGAVVEKMQYNAQRLDHKKAARSEANGKAY